MDTANPFHGGEHLGTIVYFQKIQGRRLHLKKGELRSEGQGEATSRSRRLSAPNERGLNYALLYRFLRPVLTVYIISSLFTRLLLHGGQHPLMNRPDIEYKGSTLLADSAVQ